MNAPQVWPLEPNAVHPIVEEYGYLTDIFRSYRGLEQRVQLRRHPLGAVEFFFLCDDPWEGRRISALLHRKQAQPWIVPLWQYRARPTADVSTGATSISLATSGIPFTDPAELGPYAVLWGSARAFEIIFLDAIMPTTVELAAPTVGAWSAAAVELLPARRARLDGSPDLSWITSRVLAGRVRFIFEAWRTDTQVPTATESAFIDEGDLVPAEVGP